MSTAGNPPSKNDRFDLGRFLEAQEEIYRDALLEIKRGQKRTHWMWYMFPQISGLAFSPMSRQYSIKSIKEAQAYLSHPILGARLLECARAVVDVQERSIAKIFGFPDDVKLRSCATLFASVLPSGSVFASIIDKYYQGAPDEKTLHILESLKGVVD